MAINPDDITTIRVDQLANLGLTLESLFPHTVGTELTSSPISDLVTLVANAIETSDALGFLPISVTDGQQLPDMPTTAGFFLAGAGTYLNVNGFPDVVCTENLNVIMTVDDHWVLAVQIEINPLTGSVQSVTGSAVDNTDPLNPIINLSSAVTSVNGLTGAVVVDGDNIDVTDPTTSTTAELNEALANIYASGGGGTPDLQAVTDEGNTITDGTDTNTISANQIVFNEDGEQVMLISKTDKSIIITDLITSNVSNLTPDGVSFGSTSNIAILSSDKITVNSVDYPLPTGASSQIATLEDITGGVSDGDKGDITVSGSGTVWTIDNQAVTRQKLEHIQTAHVLGRHASGTGDVQEVSPAQLRTILNVENGAEVNNISDTNATDLTDGGDTTLHTHDSRYYTETEIDAFFNLRVRTLLNDNVDSSSVTGTVANTILKSYLIPANTLAVGDTIDFKAVCSKVGTNANCNFRLYTNTSNSLTGASALALHSPINSNLYLSLDRTYTLKSGNTLQSFPVSAPSITDEAGQNTAISNTAFDPTVDNYFIVAIQPNSASDSFKQTLCYITHLKAKTSI